MKPNFIPGFLLCVAGVLPLAGADEPPKAPRQVSGIYPHLAFFNSHRECGTGAVVPWAERLWVITYQPNSHLGSTDKLYEIDAALNVVIRPESTGGTPANRMIHRESQQLFIGPYAIDAQRRVRVMSYAALFGRLTGNARHLTDPANKIYCASMEEGFYEIDVYSLAVTELFPDVKLDLIDEVEIDAGRPKANILGYHGKGLYSGQGRLVYANNGEVGDLAQRRPETISGSLSEWNGTAEPWRLVRRNQFTEVTGPGGIHGNPQPATDPIWSIGWDHRSLILMLLDGGKWHSYRLPKASHCYDGAHGWNTEWPRIRDIGPEGKPDLLMTMHGTFWRFPITFARGRSAGIAPRSTYLKVVGDFCRWGDRVVLGCDDTARSEFINKRKQKGNLVEPGQSQSNLRFLAPEQLDQLGPALGRGAVWLEDAVKADAPSEPFLFSGYERRGLHLAHDAAEPVAFTLEVDERGDDTWKPLRTVEVPARGYEWVEFPPGEKGAWVRVRAGRDCPKATAFFQFSNEDRRGETSAAIFSAIAKVGDKAATGGLIHARGDNKRTLSFAALRNDGTGLTDAGYYELDAELKLRRVDDAKTHQWVKEKVAIPRGVITVDAASVLVVDGQGRRWRLPKGDAAFDAPGLLGDERVDREVCTERDLFNAHGTFYELPAENAGDFAKIRPIATHNRRIKDYCSYRGLLVLTGLAEGVPASEHVIRSDDGAVALWVGAVDDLWQFGKPRGHGGPWKDAAIKANEPSDPYLMTGYDRKTLRIEHAGTAPVRFRVEVDLSGTGLWRAWRTFEVAPGKPLEHRFPAAFGAYWLRVVADRDCQATAQLQYD